MEHYFTCWKTVLQDFMLLDPQHWMLFILDNLVLVWSLVLEASLFSNGYD